MLGHPHAIVYGAMKMNAQNITCSLSFLRETIDRRLRNFFTKENPEPFAYPEIILESGDAPLNRFLVQHQVNVEEYIILWLALAPHLQPNFLDTIIQSYLPSGGEFPEIGGVRGTNHRGTLPTGETALFVLAGNDIHERLQAAGYFSPDHFFARENILKLEQVKDGEPRMSGRIELQQEYVELFTTGTLTKPVFSSEFPARLVTTQMQWEDLVINAKTAAQIDDIRVWLKHNNTLLEGWGMGKIVKPGCRVLFHGPPGTGKTLTATLLGKQFEREVYRIDLSQVVSKYIGETEKNLEKIFSKAEHKRWILFFDEADALFGKRSGVQNAHDRYANQEVSYLLQRVEDFPGLIILASNFKSNLDAAFIRRFNSVIHFPMPDSGERKKIWQQSIPAFALLADEVDTTELASRYELSGSSIVSVVHYACLQTIHKGVSVISKMDLLEGIRKEYEKEERVLS